jgi:hypothetical protein
LAANIGVATRKSSTANHTATLAMATARHGRCNSAYPARTTNKTQPAVIGSVIQT